MEYSRHRDRARRAYWAGEVLVLLAAAATTLAAALQARPWVTASLAATSLVLTGLRKVFDWHENWLAYAGAWIELRSAINDYRLLPEDQRDERARRDLVDKVNAVATSVGGPRGGRTAPLVSRPLLPHLRVRDQ